MTPTPTCKAQAQAKALAHQQAKHGIREWTPLAPYTDVIAVARRRGTLS